jgi:rhodanese-related sulfurtransferase
MIKQMNEISLDELKKKFKDSEIVDVREKIEYHDYNIGGHNIPAHELNHKLSLLENEEKLVVVCSNGMRSSIVARVLAKKLPTIPIFHLTEGLLVP